MSNAQKKGIAIVGYGGMGSHHGRMIEPVEEVYVCGTYDIKEDRQQAAKEAGLTPYPSFEAVLKAPEVDIVLIATPNDLHKEIAIAAMNAGKHVICEKPVTMHAVDLQEMLDCAEKNGVVFSVHQNRRWDEDFRTMEHVIGTGVLGKVFRLESRVHGCRGIPGDWRQRKAQGGGMLLDWGVHIIDQMLLMIPEKITHVSCRFDHITNDEVDDGFECTLWFESGVTAYLQVGTSNFINLPRWYVQGHNGTAVIEDWNQPCKAVYATGAPQGDATPIVTAAGLTKTMAPREDENIRREEYPIVRCDVRDFYRNFAAAVDGKEPQAVPNDQVMRVLRLLEVLHESDEKRQILPFEK